MLDRIRRGNEIPMGGTDGDPEPKGMKKSAFDPKVECSICGSSYDQDSGGIQGHFGIIPVTFCEWCYSSIYDMISQEQEG